MCVDYCRLDKLAIKNQYPLTLTLKNFNQLNKVKIYTKIDVQRAYNLICIIEGDAYETISWIKYGNLEYNVMPFTLKNFLLIFQHLIYNIYFKIFR